MTPSLTLLAATTTTAASSSKSSGSSGFFLLFLVVIAAFYFLVLRPRQNRMRQQQRAKANQIQIGDTVMSVGGIKGTVVGLTDDDVHVEVAPGVVLTFIRRAVNVQQAAEPAPEPAEPDTATDAESWPSEAGAYPHEPDAGHTGPGEWAPPSVEGHGGPASGGVTGEGTPEGGDRPGTGSEGR